MQEVLTSDATADYFDLARMSLWLGVIGHDTFLGRLSSLRAMSDPHSPQWEHSTLLLRVEDWGEEDDCGEDKEQPVDERRPTDGNRSHVVWGEDGHGGRIIIQFIPAVSTGL